MDPASIIGIIGSILSIADLISKSIAKLSRLRSTYHNTPLQVTMLIGQLHLIRAALDELEKWKKRGLDDGERYQQLVGHIESAMTCFCPLIESLQRYLDKLDASLEAELNLTTRQDKLLLMWNESDIAMYLTLADRQVNALNLLLQALQCTWGEQRNKIEQEENQTILRLARDCTSSLLCLSDGMSFASENTDAISLHFEFDSVVLCSIVYQTAFRSHLRQTIRLNRDADNLSTIAKIIAENATKDQRESPQLQADEAKSHLLTQASLASASDSSMSSYEITVDLDEVIEDDNRRQVSVANRPTATSISPKPSNKAQGLKGRMQALVINSLRQRIRHSSGRRRLSQSTVESGSLQNVVVTTTVDVDEVASAVSGTKSTIEESIKQRKVLMLGIGMSGKTTIFNSLLPLVSGEGDNSQAELSQWAPVIVKNVIENMKSILDIMGELDITFRNGTTSGCASMIVVAEATGRFEPLELAYAIKTVWADPGFKDAFQRHPRVTSEWDSLVNLVDDVDRLLQPGFVPTQQDVCKAWVRTTGIHQKVLRVRDVEISLYDVGGQRSERKKWIHCFDNVSVLMFVVDVTGYSKTMLEDNDNPGHDEQLMLFESIANSHWFTNSSMVLVMTKVDLLDDVLQRRPPTGKNFSALKPFTKERFLKHIENQFSCLMRNESKQKLLRVINADVIHSDTDAQKILELILEDLD